MASGGLEVEHRGTEMEQGDNAEDREMERWKTERERIASPFCPGSLAGDKVRKGGQAGKKVR